MSQRSDTPRSPHRGGGSQHMLRPLSLGNAISAGFTLYRSHLKPYLGISLKAHAWGLIPVYGWAKFHMLGAAIARNAYCELTNQPETVAQSQNHLIAKMWGFFVIQLLLGVILFTVQIALNIISNFVLLPLQLAPIFDSTNPASSAVVFGAIGILFFLISAVFFILYLWLVARLFVPEVAYAVEEETEMVQALERSWIMTRGKAAWQIVLMMCLVIVIVTPLYFMAFVPPLSILIPVIAGPLIGELSSSAAGDETQAILNIALILLLVIGLWLVLFFVVAVAVMPLWQTLKAIIYYDVRVRKEGMGLELRDRTIS
ncbi:MAG: hypothetical protein WBA57_06300 [Elainellaceae cyanobacterium]